MQKVVDLSKLLNDKECKIENVSYVANVLKFLNKLQSSRVGPSGRITKLTTLNNALSVVAGQWEMIAVRATNNLW